MSRFFFLYLLPVALLSTLAGAKPVLDEDEEYELLASIDRICGDSWCEGEADWSFDALRCDSEKGCILDLVMKPYPYAEEAPLDARVLSCDLSSFTKRETLVLETDRGLQYSEALYEAVDDCIFDLLEDYGPMYVPHAEACPSLFASGKARHIFLKDELSGLDAALWAVSRLVREEARKEESCTMHRIPTYRDEARCKTKEFTETCLIPISTGDYEIIRTLETDEMTVAYRP